MKVNRGLLFWGLALITGGAVALAAQQGYLDADLLAGAWRLWPLILIAIGFSVLVSGTRLATVGTVVAAIVLGVAGGALIAVGPGMAACGSSETIPLNTERGRFAGSALVTLDFNCGSLFVRQTGGDEWIVASGSQGAGPATITADRNRLHIESGRNDAWWSNGRQHWVVRLPPATTYQLEISANAATSWIRLSGGRFTSVSLSPNAGSLHLEIEEAQVDDLDLSVNAGSAYVDIGNGVSMEASMNVNAGAIVVCTFDAVALQVTTSSSITFSHNLDESGLRRVGDTWSTAGYADAADRVHIDLDGNAAEFTLKPSDPYEGCA